MTEKIKITPEEFNNTYSIRVFYKTSDFTQLHITDTHTFDTNYLDTISKTTHHGADVYQLIDRDKQVFLEIEAKYDDEFMEKLQHHFDFTKPKIEENTYG